MNKIFRRDQTLRDKRFPGAKTWDEYERQVEQDQVQQEWLDRQAAQQNTQMDEDEK